MSRPSFLQVNLAAIKNNYLLAKNMAKNSQTLAVIKANAYGCGMLRVADCLKSVADGFVVAITEEAIMLKKNGITQPILVLEGAFDSEDLKQAHAHNFWMIVSSNKQIEMLEQYDKQHCSENDGFSKLWLMVNVGMNRLGFQPNQFEAALSRLRLLAKNEEQIVICTHHSCADEKNNPTTQLKEIAKFNTITNQYTLAKSEANSASILMWPQTHSHWNRAGMMLYGVSPTKSQSASEFQLSHAQSFFTHIHNIRHIKKGEGVGYGHTWVAKRDSTIATLPIGYADGYPRTAKNGTPCFINHAIAPLVGTVSMDLITVDVTDINNPNIGDQVELWGENIDVWEVATMADTSAYELITRIGCRVPRCYTTNILET